MSRNQFEAFFVRGKVVAGFGRGSKQLGIPTANIESDVVNGIPLNNGIYYGFAQLLLNCDAQELDKTSNEQNGSHLIHENNNESKNGSLGINGRTTDNNEELSTNQVKRSDAPLYKMVCSLGCNPHFANTTRSLEVHILHDFGFDFYGSTLRVAICGHIRQEQKFDSLEQLIEAIHNDINVSKHELSDVQKWKHVTENQFFTRNDLKESK